MSQVRKERDQRWLLALVGGSCHLLRCISLEEKKAIGVQSENSPLDMLSVRFQLDIHVERPRKLCML